MRNILKSYCVDELTNKQKFREAWKTPEFRDAFEKALDNYDIVALSPLIAAALKYGSSAPVRKLVDTMNLQRYLEFITSEESENEDDHTELYNTIHIVLGTGCRSAIELLMTHGYLAKYLQKEPAIASYRITKCRCPAAIAWLSAQQNQAPISPNKYTMWSTPEPIGTGTISCQQENDPPQDKWPEELEFLLKFT